MQDEHVIRYDQALPVGEKLLEGIYLDDHVVLHICPKGQLYSSTGPERQLIERSHEAYRRFSVERACEKAFGFAVGGPEPRAAARCTLWGTLLDGERGVARTP